MILLFSVIAGIIALDQLTKWLAVIFLKNGASVPIWQDVLHLTYAENRGMAFGLLADHRWVFMVLSVVAIAALIVYCVRVRPKNLWLRLSIAMIVGGGIGNMIDRFVLGYVIDFIDFTLINFPIFNGADSFVCVGAGMLIAYLIWDMVREWKKQKSGSTPATPEAENAQSKAASLGETAEGDVIANTSEAAESHDADDVE